MPAGTPDGPPERLRYVPTRASGQLALGVSRHDPQAGACVPVCLDVFAVRGEQIRDVIAFDCLDEFSRFRLPEKLPLDHATSDPATATDAGAHIRFSGP
jgi:hypothetical protein